MLYKKSLPLLCGAMWLVACPGTEPATQDEPIIIVVVEDDAFADTPDLAPSMPDMPDMEGLDLAPTPDADASDLAEMPVACPPRPGIWTPSTQAFRNHTDATNLEALGVVGTRIAVTDFDGDGWADLVVRRASDQALEHDFAEGGVPQVWLLKNMGQHQFEDHTRRSNILARRDQVTDRGRPAEVFVFADVDNDGDVDAFTTFSNSDAGNLHPETAEIMINQGDGTFTPGDASHDLRVPGTRAFKRGGASFTDFDRDGRIDLWVGDGGDQDHLYRQEEDGRFVTVTSSLKLDTRPWSQLSDLNQARAHTNSWGVTACDLNNDGSPELMSASYGRSPNHLWRATLGLRGLSYTNASISSGYAFDDRQDWRDNESARCHCQLNPAAPDCTGVPAPELIRCASAQDVFRWDHDFDREPFRLGGNSGTTLCADLNNDGWLDLLTAEIVHWDVGKNSDPSEILYNMKQPEVSFARPGNEITGLTRTHESVTWDDGDITAAAFDFDNDGRLDLYIASTTYNETRGRLYHQRADGTFEAVALNVGIDHRSSHGIAIADFDRDGDLDLVAGHARARCSSGDHCYEKSHVRLFENTYGNQNNWVQLDLRGRAGGANALAIGARVTVTTDEITQTHEIGGGHGHYGIQHDTVAHFGLGSACRATIAITWPDGAREVQTVELDANQRYRVVQGEEPEVLEP